MKELLETAYGDFDLIARGSWNAGVKRIMLKDLYDSLGELSDAFDNMVYERLGMSAAEVLDIFDMDALLP